MIRDVSNAMLEQLGYWVMTAASGRQALEVLKTQAGHIDLVILDLIMPGIEGGRPLTGYVWNTPSCR